MKYTNLFLAFCLAAVPAGISAAPSDKKADPAVAAAQAKAKALSAKRSALWNRFYKLRDEGNRKAADGDWAAVNAIVKQVLPLFDELNAPGPMSQRDMDNFSWFFRVFQPNRKGNMEQLKGYYELMIPKATGDVKADWITNCAYFFAEQKMDTPENIGKLRNSRYDVKDMTPMKRFGYLMDDNRLEEADAVIRQVIADQKDPKEKIKLLNRTVGTFSGKQVYGSVFTRKYYADLLELTTEPDAKSALLSRWADYAEQMAILSDDEVRKLRESRFTLPGVTAKAKVEAYMNDICRSIDEAEIIEARDKALAVAGKDPDLRFRIIKLLSTNSYPPTLKLNCRDFDWYPEFFRREMTADPGFNRWQVNAMMNDYVNHFRFNRYHEVERELLAFQEKQQKRYNASLRTWKERSAKLDQAAKQDKKADLSVLKKETGEAKNRLLDAMERLTDAMNLLARYYDMNAARYYEDPDPVMIRKEIEVLRKQIAFCLTCNFWEHHIRCASDSLFRVAELYFRIGDFAAVRQCAERNTELMKVQEAYDRRQVWGIQNNAAKYPYLLGFCAFEEENYEECIRQLEPLIKSGARHYGLQRNNDPRTNIYDRLLRSHVALGDLKGAMKYEQKFFETSAWYMQKTRIRPQLDALKERAAEAEAKE